MEEAVSGVMINSNVIVAGDFEVQEGCDTFPF